MIQDLALILVVAGIVTLVFKRLKQPLVLGYIVAGFLVSPHMPLTASVADMANIHLWADIGVMFLLFSLGLDFSFKKILKMGASPIISTVTIIFSMSMLGIIVGHLFGWTKMDCIFLGGMLAMSSTTIIYKAFADLGLRQQQFAGLVMSVLILEDILAIVMMVMLSAIAGGGNPDGGQMVGSVLKIGFFLVLWLVVGIFAVPLFLRKVRKLINAEVLLIVSLGLSLGVIGDFLYPVVVAVSVITTFLTPYMIRLATPVYNALEPRLPSRLISSLNHLSTSRSETTERSGHNSLWKRLLKQMTINTVVYSILSTAVITLMFMFVLPLTRRMLPGWELHWYANAITGSLTVLLIAPFLRAMVMKKNRSEEWKALWAESNRNRLPLLFTILVRFVIAVNFIFYICNYLSRFTPAIMITIGVVLILLIVASRRIKHNSIRLERLFINNLRSRDIEAQVHGRKRPLYENRLLDRDIHIADFEVPVDSRWAGCTLKELALGRKYGVHVSSILRGGRRLNIPDGDSIIFPADHLQVIGSDEQLSLLHHTLETDVLGDDPELEKREMRLRQLIIGTDSPFIGQTLEESGIRSHYSCMVVGLEEGKENLSTFSPKRRFKEGDIIWIVGEQESLESFLK